MDAIADSSQAMNGPDSWAAHLDVHFSQREGKTKVTHSAHFGPLRIQRPFYPEGNGTAHLYLLHPPGGVAGGDVLRTTIESGEHTHALLTTPAATKLYKSVGPKAGVLQTLSVRKGAFLEWLPQETIAFSGANAQLQTLVQLEEGAQFMGWELLCLGRPASGDHFSQGRITQRFEVWRQNRPLYVDRLVVGDHSALRGAVWGMNQRSVVSTLVITASSDSLVSLVRHTLDLLAPVQGMLACTALSGVTLVRYVGDSVPECWAAFVRVWESVRPVLSGNPAVLPRIWSC